MTTAVKITTQQLENLDLTPIKSVIEPWLNLEVITAQEQQLTFTIDYFRDPEDPRELSEIPEIRLWFLRLDSCYPWLPFFLDWKQGELALYAAMLVPHQFHRTEGIQYNPEALEIFVMQKVFIITDWLSQWQIPSKSRVKAMAQIFGYELDDEFLEHLKTN